MIHDGMYTLYKCGLWICDMPEVNLKTTLGKYDAILETCSIVVYHKSKLLSMKVWDYGDDT